MKMNSFKTTFIKSYNYDEYAQLSHCIGDNILVLGHGKMYKKEDIRCSPILVDLWYDKKYISIDTYEEVKPDILFDLCKNKTWKIIKDNEYDTIIDTTGGILSLLEGRKTEKHQTTEYKMKEYVLKEAFRILKMNGIFYTKTGHYKKIDDHHFEYIKKTYIQKLI